MAKKNERKITASGSSSKATNKVLKPGSMASNSKMVTPKPKAKASTKYSPAPMSAFAKEKAAMRGAVTQGKTGKMSPAQKKEFKKLYEGTTKEGKSVAGKVGAAAGKVAKRAKTTAREARDVATAVGTLGKAAAVTAQFPKRNKGVAKSAAKNLVKQIKETGTAAKSGKKGTTSSKAVTTSYDKNFGQPTSAKITKGTKRK